MQKLIDHYGYERYLEIGVHRGKTFFSISCKNKIAVDPAFKISPGTLFRSLRSDPGNFRNRYYLMTSDKFFEKKIPNFSTDKFPDLVFIDGLHTFAASLRDVMNSLKYIKPQGSIVLHDCFPPNAAAATPAISLKKAAGMNIPGWTGTWCGDVWKTIVYLKKKYGNVLIIDVLDDDMGLGIVRLNNNYKKVDQELDVQLFSSVNEMTYEDLQENPQSLINLCEFHENLRV